MAYCPAEHPVQVMRGTCDTAGHLLGLRQALWWLTQTGFAVSRTLIGCCMHLVGPGACTWPELDAEPLVGIGSRQWPGPAAVAGPPASNGLKLGTLRQTGDECVAHKNNFGVLLVCGLSVYRKNMFSVSSAYPYLLVVVRPQCHTASLCIQCVFEV